MPSGPEKRSTKDATYGARDVSTSLYRHDAKVLMKTPVPKTPPNQSRTSSSDSSEALFVRASRN